MTAAPSIVLICAMTPACSMVVGESFESYTLAEDAGEFPLPSSIEPGTTKLFATDLQGVAKPLCEGTVRTKVDFGRDIRPWKFLHPEDEEVAQLIHETEDGVPARGSLRVQVEDPNRAVLVGLDEAITNPVRCLSANVRFDRQTDPALSILPILVARAHNGCQTTLSITPLRTPGELNNWQQIVLKTQNAPLFDDADEPCAPTTSFEQIGLMVTDGALIDHVRLFD